MTITDTEAPEGADLRQAEQAILDARQELDELVDQKRTAGWSWARIGAALGVSRQAAWERFHAKADQ